MTSNININDNYDQSSKNMSICIPRVFSDIHVSFITNIFQYELNLGIIKKIDVIKNNDNNFKKVFIHFDEWHNNEKSNTIKQKLLDGKTIKVVYDNPWFWKCSLNKSN